MMEERRVETLALGLLPRGEGESFSVSSKFEQLSLPDGHRKTKDRLRLFLLLGEKVRLRAGKNTQKVGWATDPDVARRSSATLRLRLNPAPAKFWWTRVNSGNTVVFVETKAYVWSLGVLSVLMMLLATGCGDTSARPKTDDQVVAVNQQDAEMNAAIAKAQATLTNFIAVLSSPQTNQQYFLVKGKFIAGDAVEHIWVADVTFDGKAFRGVLANDPERIPGLSFKQPVKVQPAQVSDWMFVQDGKLVGGYTSRVLRSRMTEEERRDLDAKIPYRYN